MDASDTRRGFGSDNHAGAHPEILAAIAGAGEGHVPAYGDDPWTQNAIEVVKGHVGDAQVALVWNGTGANVVALSALCRPWESVICAETAHINVDECGAPEHVANVKLVAIPTPDGKLTSELVRPHLVGFGFEHHAQPKVISVSNVSEFGTVYRPEELRALADLAHSNGMYLHVDGARISNACASLGLSMAALTSEVGVDALSLGGTKNGAVALEAVVLFGDARTEALPYVRKQSAQLASKMRFVAAQVVAMYEDDLWLRLAAHANAMAARLAAGAEMVGLELAQPVDANEVFPLLTSEQVAATQERFRYYTWDESPRGDGRVCVRWVTSWDTTEQDVDALLEAL
jgi:threonine aldolase